MMAEPLTRREALLALLRSLHGGGRDKEHDHGVADDALLRYINDSEITEAFEAIERWYA